MRNRVLGIAALMGATAAAVIVVVMSPGDGPRVTPLREEKTKQERRGDRSEDASPGTRWLVAPAPRSRLPARRIERARSKGARDRERPARRRGRPAAKPRARKYERTRRARSRNPRRPRGRTTPSLPLAVPAPGPASAPPSKPPASAEPARPGQPATQLSNTPETATTSEPRPTKIEIEDGELETELDRVHAQDGRVRLHIHSDQFVVVEVEHHELSRLVPAGGEALLEFDTLSTKGFEIELRRRKGVLVLRLDD
jgi:hypothetical protein